MTITKDNGGGSENDGEVVVALEHISNLLQAGDLAGIQKLVGENYSFSTDNLDEIVAHFKPLISPPIITPLTKSAELIANYEARVQSSQAKEFYTLFEQILPNLNTATCNYVVQTYFAELLAISTFAAINISELIASNKIEAKTCDFLVQQVFILFAQYNSQTDDLKSDRTLTAINHLIDNFILSSEHLLNKSAQELGQDLLSWLQLMKRSDGESLSRSGGTATKVAALCYKLGKQADLGITENEINALQALMQSKLPTEDVNKLTTLFLQRGASCHRASHGNQSALNYAIEHLSFGQGVIEIMFRYGEIPIPYLRNMLEKAKSGEMYSQYILQIVETLTSKKALTNREIQQLMLWIVTNSSTANSKHPSYGYRKYLHVLINHLLSDEHWTNFDLQVVDKSLWEQLSSTESAEQISKLNSITDVLEAFKTNTTLENKLPKILGNLTALIFSDKVKSKDGVQAIQFLQFIVQNPQYTADVADGFDGWSVSDSITRTQREFAFLSNATREASNQPSPFANAVINLNAEFIRLCLGIYKNTDKEANNLSQIGAALAKYMRQIVLKLSSAKTEISKRFIGIEKLLNAELAHAMVDKAQRLSTHQETAPFLQLILGLNAQFPQDSQATTASVEDMLSCKTMLLVENLSNADESILAEVKSLLTFLKSASELLDNVAGYLGYISFEGNLYHQCEEAIIVKYAKNQFILTNLGLSTQISTKIVPSPAGGEEIVLVDKEQEEGLVATTKNTFLGFGLFAKAKAKFNNLVAAGKEDPVLAILLRNRQPEDLNTQNGAAPTPSKF